MSTAHQLINQDSGNVEWYTPLDIIEAARETMGGIDLDPASSDKANERVRATHYFTAEDDGLKRRWYGRVWMNHPFGRGVGKVWVGKIIHESHREKRSVMAAICITYASTSEKWFRPLLQFPQCYLYGRTNYINQNGEQVKGASKGSVVTLVKGDLDKFREAFKHLGAVKV